MRRSLLLALCLTAAAIPTSAQATWHGVHFGESRDDVRSQITSQNLPLSTSQDGALQTNTDYDLALPGLRHTFPMVVSFHFDDASALTDITLTLDLPGMHRFWSPIGADDAILNFAAEHLTTALSSIYGAPSTAPPPATPSLSSPSPSASSAGAATTRPSSSSAPSASTANASSSATNPSPPASNSLR